MMKVGTIYYPTGEVYFIGSYDETKLDSAGIPYCRFAGVEFYKDGTIHREGLFQQAGLFFGRLYYPSGKLKFIGQFNDKHGMMSEAVGSYYGPSYPVEGVYYAESGEVLYRGRFKVRHRGNLGWPEVVFPEGFGSF